MKKKFRSFFWLAWLALLALLAAGASSAGRQATRITAAQAKDHVGERATVCGLVAGTRYLDKTKGKPTFLNFDRRYPHHTFTAVIWEAARARFAEAPERAFDGRRVCVTGQIKDYKGQPEIIVNDPAQITAE